MPLILILAAKINVIQITFSPLHFPYTVIVHKGPGRNPIPERKPERNDRSSRKSTERR
jgi:hypothetical protein